MRHALRTLLCALGAGLSAPALACSIQFTSPQSGAVVNTQTIGVSGTASGFANPGAVGSASATVNGRVFFQQSGTFTALINFFGSGAATVSLDRGVNTLRVTGSVSGCSAAGSITITYEPPPAQPNPPKNSGPGCDQANKPAGNPCDPATGNKFQRETDYVSPQRLPLLIERFYNSNVGQPGSIGMNWTAPWDRRVTIASATATRASVSRPDGKVLSFTLTSGIWNADADVNHRLLEIKSGGTRTGWQVVSSSNAVEAYDATGRLVRVADATGSSHTLSYSDDSTPVAVAPQPGLVIRVTDSFDRQINLTYDTSARVVTAVDPEDQVFRYGYDAAGNLALVEAPWGPGVTTIRRYLYNEPSNINNGVACAAGLRPTTHLLTGIQDEAGSRFATFKYDCQSRAVSTEHAGGVARYAFAYTLNASGAPISTTITDPLGTVLTRTYVTTLGVPRGTSNVEPCAASGCAGSNSSTYGRDANGNAAEVIDFNGARTVFTHDLSRNLETQRVESSGTPLARTTRSAWHPDWRLQVKRAEPRRITTLVYNGQPDPLNGGATASCAPADALLPGGKPIAVLCRVVEQATTDASGESGFNAELDPAVAARTWAYTYNAQGQMLTALDALGRLTTHAYHEDTTADHTIGDPASVTNPAGQVTRYTRYDRSGRLLQSIDPNGVVSDLRYTPRGWVEAVTVTPYGHGGAACDVCLRRDGTTQEGHAIRRHRAGVQL